MKKAIFSLFFICFLSLGVFADFQVDQATINAQVSDTGTAQVTASFQLSFSSTQDSLQVPLPDGEISRVSAETYRYSVSRGDDVVDVVLTGSFSGTQTVTVSYQVDSSPVSGDEGETYTLGLLSSRWACQVGACSIQVTLPQASGTMPQDYSIAAQILSGYYGALSQDETGLTINGTIINGSTGNRMAYDSLSLQADVPTGYFYTRTAAIPMVHITYLAVGMLAVLGLLILFWYFRLRTPPQEISTRLLTPGGLLPCQLPQLLDGKTCDVALLILEWANLGYLTIRRSKRGYIILTRLLPMGSERSQAEQRLFQQIFSTGYRVAATPGRFSAAGARFCSASRRSLNRVLFDRKGGNIVLLQLPCRILLAVSVGYVAYENFPTGAAFLVLSVFAGLIGFLFSIYLHSALADWKSLKRFGRNTAILLLVCVLLLVIALLNGGILEMFIGLCACGFSSLASASGPRRSTRGQELMAQAKGCRLFYQRVNWQRLQLLMARNGRFFQLQLPKAAALGVDRSFAQRFEQLPVTTPEWLGTGASNTALQLQRQIRDILADLREAFR